HEEDAQHARAMPRGASFFLFLAWLAIGEERPIALERHPHGRGAYRPLRLATLGDLESGDLPPGIDIRPQPGDQLRVRRVAVLLEPLVEGLRVVGLEHDGVEAADALAIEDADSA